MITIEDIRERVGRELRGKLPEGVTIAPDTAIKDLGLSSLQISEIVFGLEEDYDVEFDAALAADAKTVGDLLAVANQALAAKDGGQSQQAAGVGAGDGSDGASAATATEAEAPISGAGGAR